MHSMAAESVQGKDLVLTEYLQLFHYNNYTMTKKSLIFVSLLTQRRLSNVVAGVQNGDYQLPPKLNFYFVLR